MWRHPKYYKELRKRNRDLSELQQVKLERSVPQSDQAISNPRATAGDGSVRPGPGLKQQASSSKLTETNCPDDKNQEQQASSRKLQAPSSKPQASSRKRQAP